MDSVDTIERVANTEPPPLKAKDILDLRDRLSMYPAEKQEITKKLSGMATAFKGRSPLSTWDEVLLEKIDRCFVANFYDAGGPCASLYFPDSADYINRFTKYCSDVDLVFLNNANISPPYAREYFAYAMMWNIHGLKFPMPLGTASAVAAVDALATKYRKGLSEVSVR